MSEETNVPAEDENQPVEETTDEQTTGEPVEETEDSSGEPEEPKEDSKEEPEEEEVERPVHKMPVKKAQKEKARAVEKAKEETEAKFNEELTELRQELNDFKENLGADKINEIVKEREFDKHRTKASDDFDKNVVDLIKKDFPGATQKFVDNVKGQVLDLIFKKGYNSLPVKEIYGAKKSTFDFKNSLSAEPSGGRSSELTDFGELSPDDEHQLALNDPERYKEYLQVMRTKQGSRYLD